MMTTEWYLRFLEKVFHITGLSGRTFVGDPPQPMKKERQKSPIENLQRFDLL